MRTVTRKIYRIADTYINIDNITTMTTLRIDPNYGQPYAEGFINGIKLSCCTFGFKDTQQVQEIKYKEFVRDYNTLLNDFESIGD